MGLESCAPALGWYQIQVAVGKCTLCNAVALYAAVNQQSTARMQYRCLHARKRMRLFSIDVQRAHKGEEADVSQ